MVKNIKQLSMELMHHSIGWNTTKHLPNEAIKYHDTCYKNISKFIIKYKQDFT